MIVFLTRTYVALVTCFAFASLYAAEKKEDFLESADLRVSLIITKKHQDCSQEYIINRRVKGKNASLTIKSQTPIERTDREKLVKTLILVDKITENILEDDLKDYCHAESAFTTEPPTDREDDSECQKDSASSSSKPLTDKIAEIPQQSSYSLYKWIIPIGGTIAFLAFNWAKIMSLRKCK
jgi:hypothetical protein